MKKLTAIILSMLILISGIAAASAATISDIEIFKQFKLEELKTVNPEATADDIEVEVFESIGSGRYLERIRQDLSISAQPDNLGEYLYTTNSSAYMIFIFDSVNRKEYELAEAYDKGVIEENELPLVASKLNGVKGVKFEKNIITLKAGVEKKRADNVNVNWKIANKNIAKIVKEKGGILVVGLTKGTTTFTGKTKNGKPISCKVTVTSSPEISKTTIKVKKGKTAKLKLTGKSKRINNVYYGTKIAKIVSKKSDASLKIKGLKKGTTTLKVKVNGVKSLKVKVKVV